MNFKPLKFRELLANFGRKNGACLSRVAGIFATSIAKFNTEYEDGEDIKNNDIVYHFHSCPRFLKIVKAASNISPMSEAAMYHLVASPVTTDRSQTAMTPWSANRVRTSIARVTMNHPIMHRDSSTSCQAHAHAYHVHRNRKQF